MKKQITVGLPRAFLYYRYQTFWTTFFQKLDIKIITSPETNKQILQEGIDLSIDESCISAKIYLGHVKYLVNKCDYLLIPRISDYGKKEKTCVKFNGLYDTVRNTFPNQKILDYNIEKTKHTQELLSFIKIGKKLHKNIFQIIRAYFLAKKADKLEKQKQFQLQEQKKKSPSPKILIISHPYNIYDKFLGEPIINIIKQLNIEILQADKLDPKIAKKNAQKLSPTLYWTYSKELIGAIDYYKKDINGIIFISSFPCGPDSLVNELILRKITDLPMLNILINESTAEAGLQTRLESFIDILKMKENNHD